MSRPASYPAAAHRPLASADRGSQWRLFEAVFLAAVALAVTARPEGRPAVITTTRAIGVQRMARRHAITRRLLCCGNTPRRRRALLGHDGHLDMQPNDGSQRCAGRRQGDGREGRLCADGNNPIRDESPTCRLCSQLRPLTDRSRALRRRRTASTTMPALGRQCY